MMKKSIDKLTFDTARNSPMTANPTACNTRNSVLDITYLNLRYFSRLPYLKFASITIDRFLWLLV